MLFRQFLCLLMFVALSAHIAHAKCAAMVITVHGTITNDHDNRDQQKVIHLVSFPDANWNNTGNVTAAEDFKSIFYFDTTRSAGHFSHKCSREPQFVDVVLTQKGIEVGRVKLHFPMDFEETSPGHYENVVAVKLGDFFRVIFVP